MTRLVTIPVGRREVTLTIEDPGDLVLAIGWPTAVHHQAMVMLDPSTARALRDSLSEWLGAIEDQDHDHDVCRRPGCGHPRHQHSEFTMAGCAVEYPRRCLCPEFRP